MRLRESVTHIVSPEDFFPRGFAEDLDHGAYVGDGFGRGAQERNQTFPWILPDHSQPPIFFNSLVNDRVSVDLFVNEIQILIQSKKSDYKSPIDSFVEEELSDLPDGKNPVRRLNNIVVEDFGKSKKLSAFQGMLK
jgi:hypothetical protein